MPVTWQFLDKVLVVTIVGCGGEQSAEVVVEAMSDPRFTPGTAVLFDIRQATDEPSSAELNRRARRLSSLCALGLSSRCAVVIGTARHHVGRAGLASIHLDTQGMELQIFTNIRDAQRWLASTGGLDRERPA
jgi:hypothetical protein